MPAKPKKKRARYGDYCETIRGELYARINIPIGNGKYKPKRKKVANKTEARQWAQEELDRIRHGSAQGTLNTFTDLVEWFKKYYLVAPVYEAGKKVEGTKDWERSRRKLDRMCEYFGPKRLSSFSKADLMAYSRDRRKGGVSTATINRDFALMRTMFRAAQDADSSITVPKFPINPKGEVERDRVMSFEEEKRLLAVCTALETLEYERKGKQVKTDKHRSNREHLRAIIIMAVDTAMRAGEIFSLEWSDIDLKAGVIEIQSHNTKTQKSRKVGITPRLKKELEAIKGKGRVFPLTSVRKSFATACRNAKIKDLHFHDLRHTATTRMIRSGAPHTEVMKITGHTQLKTFLRYLNLGDDTVKGTASLLAEYLDTQRPVG